MHNQAPISSRPSFGARAVRTPAFVVGAGLTGVLLLLAVLAPVIGRYSPVQQNLLATLQGPSAAHWLGTDEFGRDIWSRLLYGGRTDLQVGVLAVVFPFCFGSLLGTLCGYLGGWLDGIVMRVVDVVLAFPFYVLIIALVFFVGEGTHGIYIAFALTDWVVYARTTRSAALVAVSQDWVAAAEGGGLSRSRVLLRHVLPNTISQAIVYVDVGHRAGHPGRRHPWLPGARHPAARAGLGRDDQRRPGLHHRAPVAVHHPRHRGHPGRRRPLAARGRARRPAAAAMSPPRSPEAPAA